MNPPPALILMAMGAATAARRQPPMLLEQLGSGTVLGMSLRHAVMSQLPLVVVSTAELAPHAARVVASRDVVVLAEPSPRLNERLGERSAAREGGWGRAIAAGVAARGDAAGWIVLPADRPWVSPDLLRTVARALTQHIVVSVQHRGRRGYPMGFSGELYSELIALAGDDAAMRLTGRFPSHPLEIDDPEIMSGIENDGDLQRARERLARAEQSEVR